MQVQTDMSDPSSNEAEAKGMCMCATEGALNVTLSSFIIALSDQGTSPSNTPICNACMYLIETAAFFIIIINFWLKGWMRGWGGWSWRVIKRTHDHETWPFICYSFRILDEMRWGHRMSTIWYSMRHISRRPFGADYIKRHCFKWKCTGVRNFILTHSAVKSRLCQISLQQSVGSYAFYILGAPILFHACTRAHTRTDVMSAHASTAPCTSSELQIWYPQKLRIVCSSRAQHIFWIRFRRADDTDARAHRAITGLLPEQHWIVAAERRMRSEARQTQWISHGSRTRMLFSVHPHERMTTSKQTYTENFQLSVWRGGVIEIFFPTRFKKQTSCRCKLWANVTEMTCWALTRFIVPWQPCIVRCHFTLRYPSVWNSNILGLLCN